MRLAGICKSFGGKTVLSLFNLELSQGGRYAIMGPSGCGKSTVLNILSGLLSPDEGTVEGVAGKRLSYVFQDNRLLPWRNVRDNIEFAMDRSINAVKRKELCIEALETVEMEGFINFYPAQLSGGMARRTAIARAISCPGDILIMDEPFTGLDEELKERIIGRLDSLVSNRGTTLIVATHEKDEALKMGCTIIEMGCAAKASISLPKDA